MTTGYSFPKYRIWAKIGSNDVVYGEKQLPHVYVEKQLPTEKK